jgi:hypothetical protein
LTLNVLDRCRRDYTLPERCGAETYMGVDVGVKLHVVIRRQFQDDQNRSRAVFIGEVDSFEELRSLIERYRVVRAVVDALPEQRAAAQLARETTSARVGLAFYGRTDPGCETSRDNGVWVYRINRAEALEETFHGFQTEKSELPQNARELGGHVRDGLGDYYRQLLAISRVLEQNAQGNWVARFTDQGRPDHYAHAETYCRVAMNARVIQLVAY